jgi:hypothetical protein
VGVVGCAGADGASSSDDQAATDGTEQALISNNFQGWAKVCNLPPHCSRYLTRTPYTGSFVDAERVHNGHKLYVFNVVPNPDEAKGWVYQTWGTGCGVGGNAPQAHVGDNETSGRIHGHQGAIETKYLCPW